jgi:hypothetical protein
MDAERMAYYEIKQLYTLPITQIDSVIEGVISSILTKSYRSDVVNQAEAQSYIGSWRALSREVGDNSENPIKKTPPHYDFAKPLPFPPYAYLRDATLESSTLGIFLFYLI